ncbi:RluA family pseudouridine synthase [Deinococcus sp. RIT780]|uniref:RluA family pseudouridine synthase n=1 Tax=Deinococcus sp. RIT780 TaxID=2870472 RepID=UPI001C89FA35|nr:RluA family pseudouridine synthase [Deinococcus sp. RIT780]MBX8464052.1 RluA family pseudouridine synthase [Deinococcus sp. RIT780]
MSDDAPSNAGFAFRSQVRAGGESVLAFLTREYRHSDGASWASRLAAGEVEVRGVRARGDEVLRGGDVVVWHRPPWREEAAPLDYAVLLEDDALVAVSKPPGLPTLPGAGFLTHTLLTQVRLRYPGASPLHRLGRGTSGAVLFARTGEAGAALSRAWREHEVRKVYRALGAGVPQWDTLDIQAPIGPVPHPRLGSVFAASAEGKASRSVATVRERREDCTLFDVEIHTGRPHQIRIHLAAAGHPLLGDPLYGVGGHPLPDLPGLPGDLGYHLHAWTLHFRHPVTGQAVRVEAPPPPGLS